MFIDRRSLEQLAFRLIPGAVGLALLLGCEYSALQRGGEITSQPIFWAVSGFACLSVLASIVLMMRQDLFRKRLHKGRYQNQRIPVWLLLIPILLLASALRLHNLGSDSLWYDELWSWRATTGGTIQSVYETIPPNWSLLYPLVLLPIQNYLGDSEFLLRLPAGLAGIVGVAAIYATGARVYSRRVGVVAALFMAIAYAPIRYSQEARDYSFLITSTILTFYFWISLLQHVKHFPRLAGHYALGYLVCSLLLSYSHYFGALTIALQAVITGFLLLRRPKALEGFALLYLILGTAYLPIILPHLLSSIGSGWLDWVNAPSSIRGHFNRIRDFLVLAFNDSETLTASVLTLWGVAAFQFLNINSKDRDQEPTKLSGLALRDDIVLMWFFLPFITAYIITMTLKPILVPRYFLGSVPAAYLLLSRAVGLFRFRFSHSMILVSLISMFFFVNLFGEYDYYKVPQRPPVREAVQYISERADDYPRAKIINIRIGYPSDIEWELDDYYFSTEKLSSNQPLILITGARTQHKELVRNMIESEAPEFIWIVGNPVDSSIEVFEYIEQHYDLQDQHVFHGLDLRLFQQK